MNLKDPVPAYSGAGPAEVHILRNLLSEAGIEAFVPEDVDTSWTGGGLPGIQTPQVFIERADLERARPILEDYERSITERVEADLDSDTEVAPIEVTCDRCHKESTYPHAQIGSVQSCPACGAYVDVTLDDTPDEQRVTTRDP
jgi:Putative prokaryotic signal transducing protein